MSGELTATRSPAGRSASATRSGDQPSTSCRYRVIMNWKLMYEPNRATALRLARTIGPIRRMPRRISGWRTRFSVTTNATSSAAASANEPTVSGSSQPRTGADTTVYTARSMPPVRVTAPVTSWPPAPSRRPFGMSR
jgi:hypothetical protein